MIIVFVVKVKGCKRESHMLTLSLSCISEGINQKMHQNFEHYQIIFNRSNLYGDLIFVLKSNGIPLHQISYMTLKLTFLSGKIVFHS